MTEQHPGNEPDLSQTRAFQPLDPYGTEAHRPGDYGAGEYRAGEYEDEEFDGPRPSLRERISGWGAVRTASVGAAVLLVVGGVAWGTSAALATTDASSPTTQASQNPVVPLATGSQSSPTKKPAKAVRVMITHLGVNSFTGTDGKGRTVTVAYGADTKFGNKARPLSPAQLAAGMAVTVLGERTGDSVIATSIGTPVKKGSPAPSGTPSEVPTS